jgi:hypothetical protein
MRATPVVPERPVGLDGPGAGEKRDAPRGVFAAVGELEGAQDGGVAADFVGGGLEDPRAGGGLEAAAAGESSERPKGGMEEGPVAQRVISSETTGGA